MTTQPLEPQYIEASKERRFATLKAIIAVLLGRSLPRNPVPIARMAEAKLAGFEDVRECDGKNRNLFKDDILESIKQEHEGDFPKRDDGLTPYDILAIAGGGANGAFGAGFLCGWSQAGTRPNFKLVTGISTGAIIASLAFLGPDYDHLLREIYTTISTLNVFNTRNVISWLWNESFADTGPLEKLIGKYADEAHLQAIAKAHANGRRFYVATANLDAQRLVVWNIGAIANSNHPKALDIYKKIMLASVSIPCIFPPVFFDVQVAGRLYDEMHCDGGMITDAFVCDFMLHFPTVEKKDDQPGNSIYIIRNDKIKPSPEQVSRSLSKITRRALSTLNKAHGEDHLHCIYAITQRNHFDFNYVGIPDNCVLPDKLTFDKKQMNKLFDLGVKLAKSGYDFYKTPPTFNGSQ